MVNGIRSLRRVHDGILIHMDFEAWPRDVPLPKGTTLMETGEGLFWPYWKIYLEPDKTVEKIAGWFIVPLSVEETMEWYAAELKKRGWMEVERSDTLPTWAMLRYCHPETDPDTETNVVIDIRYNRYLNRAQPMIWRVTIHPWSPPEEAEAFETEAEWEVSDGGTDLSERGPDHGMQEMLEKIAIK